MKSRVLHDVLIIEPKGRLDIHTNEVLEQQFFDLLDKNGNCHLLIDFSHIEYISSSGVGLMISIQRRLSSQKLQMKICSLSSAVLRIFNAVGMTESFNVFDDVNSALDDY